MRLCIASRRPRQPLMRFSKHAVNKKFALQELVDDRSMAATWKEGILYGIPVVLAHAYKRYRVLDCDGYRERGCPHA